MKEITFKDYYTFPLNFMPSVTSIIWNDKGGMAFNVICNMDTEVLKKIIDKLNDPKKNNYKKKREGQFTHEKGYIKFNNINIFLIRGWGGSTGEGGMNLSPELAIKLQNDFANYIIQTLNN